MSRARLLNLVLALFVGYARMPAQADRQCGTRRKDLYVTRDDLGQLKGELPVRTLSPLLLYRDKFGAFQVFAYEDICKDRGYLYSCLDQLPPLISREGNQGIPNSKKQVDAVCSAFKKGMQCIDLYSDTCLSPKVRQVINENVAGARHTFAFLCDDPLFQSEYLQYAPCYRAVTKDWDFCANRFLKHVSPYNYSTSSTTETCCAKQAFHRCVYEFGNMRCRPDAAFFLRRIAETLSNVHVYRMACFPEEKYDTMCASSKCDSSHSISSVSLVAVSMFFSAFPLYNYCKFHFHITP